eukprot:scaffold262_cov103-Isochrysis_galbana.AAC.8
MRRHGGARRGRAGRGYRLKGPHNGAWRWLRNTRRLRRRSCHAPRRAPRRAPAVVPGLRVEEGKRGGEAGPTWGGEEPRAGMCGASSHSGAGSRALASCGRGWAPAWAQAHEFSAAQAREASRLGERAACVRPASAIQCPAGRQGGGI